MSATNRYMNVSACTFTPTGGSAAALKGIKSLAFDENGDMLSEGADFDLIDTVYGVVKLAPMVTIETIDAMYGLVTLAAGVVGVLVFTVRDFTNGATASGGAKIFTVSNAVLQPRKTASQYRQLGTQTVAFGTFSTDGSTNPVAVAAA